MRSTPTRLIWSASALLLVAAGCSDYDLHRPDKVEDDAPGDVDSGDPEPSDEPDIAVTPAIIDFGGLAKDCPADPIEVTITNEGLADLVVSEVALDGQGTSAFSHDYDNASELTLAYGESHTFEVNFTPTAWVDYEIEVQVSSNDPDESRVDVPTQGNGAEDSMYEEGFTQDFHEEVDVLWVVDNSCSMDEELQRVRDNFDFFITEFVGLGLDFNLAVITTDMDTAGHQGAIQGGIITEDSSDPEAEFLTNIDQGSSGSGSEKGLAATKAALSDPLLSGDNAGFMRDDAALAVVIVSDEDDDSSTSSSSFASFLLGLKSDAELVSFSSIVGDPVTSSDWLGGCQEWSGADMLSASAGTTYVEVSDATGGIFASICTSNYDEALQHVSLTSAGMTVEFQLSQEPSDLAQMTVTVAGNDVGNDASDGWTYDATTNTITFHGDAIPGPGDDVVVSYPVASECGS